MRAGGYLENAVVASDVVWQLDRVSVLAELVASDAESASA